MSIERTGSILKRNGKIYARVTFTDKFGRRRELTRRAVDKADAKAIIKDLLEQVESAERDQRLEGLRMTFSNLAERYKVDKLVPPVYHNERKVAGLRSYVKQLSFLKPLIEFFGKKLIRDIRVSDLERYKLERLKTPTKRGDERSITCVNRELALLRVMLNYAVRECWLQLNPFTKSKGLISLADEEKRERILSSEEETKLLNACTGNLAHLRAFVIASIDTGMRRGEMLTLTKSDIDIRKREINLRAYNTKTAKSRTVPISNRLYSELLPILLKIGDGDRVFPFDTNISNQFKKACEKAEIEDCHLHDLRHSFASRMISSGIPLVEVMRLLGHTKMDMSFRYVNLTDSTLERAREALNTNNA